MIILWIVMVLTCGETEAFLKSNISEDANLDIVKLVNKYGYRIETHEVVTKDGYLLNVHRIPGRYSDGNDNGNITKGPVLLMHGLFTSSDDYVVMGPGKGLGYILADDGYDVWIGNSRGNKHSRRHKYLSPKSRSFWNFNLDGLVIDVADMIDYILMKTKKKQLKYIGHSQGTCIFLILCSVRPEYNKKINIAVLLAPVAYSSHVTSPLMVLLVRMSTLLQALLPTGEVLPHLRLLDIISQIFCNELSPFRHLCTAVIFLFAGENQKQLNATMLPVILSHAPAGCSVAQLLHYNQLYRQTVLRKYNYGFVQNLRKYGTILPPAYRIDTVTAPIMLAYGQNDLIADPTDVHTLKAQLKNVVSFYRVPDPKFNHVDFLWANDANTLLYPKVLKIMEKF